MEESVRINLYISRSGAASRRNADHMIAAGRVEIEEDGIRRKAVPGDRVHEGSRVYLDGIPLSEEEKKRYILYHKPAGVSCTALLSDPSCILHRIIVPERVTYAGRLDKDSTGLVLLTNDGRLNNALMRSANRHEKEYLCTLDRPYDRAFIRKMEKGVPILDTVTRPCTVIPEGPASFRIILTQGLNRQIRRMCGALGYGVRSIHRIRIANLLLGDLPEDEYRDLTESEREQLFKLTGSNE